MNFQMRLTKKLIIIIIVKRNKIKKIICVLMGQLFSQVFLSGHELKNLSEWKYKVTDRGILSRVYNPFYNWVVKIVPRSVSPNVLSFAGLLFSIYAWWFSIRGNTWVNNVVSASCIIIYTILDAIDGKHARNTRTSSPMGELIDHFCDCITNALLISTFCNVYDITTYWHVWLMILSTQMSFLLEHIKAYTDKDKMLRFHMFTGPTEALTGLVLMIYTRPAWALWETGYFYLSQYVLPYGMMLVGFISMVMIMYHVIKHYRLTKNYSTMFGIFVSFSIQVVKFFTVNNNTHISDAVSSITLNGVMNGITFSLICADIIISKMADRHLHQLIPVIQIISCFDIIYIDIALVLIYFIINIIDISLFMKIPIFSPVFNVFVSGYYDGFHFGHLMSLIIARLFGSKLIVGIHSQYDLTRTKGKVPMKTAEERYNDVNKSNIADVIIRDCPLVFTREFIDKYNIHIVGISDEYCRFDDDGNIIGVHESYQVPFDMGILKIVPRTGGVSSSELREMIVQTKIDPVKIERMLQMVEEMKTNIDHMIGRGSGESVIDLTHGNATENVGNPPVTELTPLINN